MLADAQMKLAKTYRQQHKLALAEEYATQAFSHTELTKNLFTAPARLEFAAQLQWDLGRRSQARRSITRALDISEGLLARTSSGAVREGLLTEMSSAYETAFKFAAQSGDVSSAFAVVERVRGRITAETLVQPQHFSGQMNIALEDEIRNFKIQLIKTKSESDRNRLIDTLFYAEQKRFVADRPAQVYTSRTEAIPLQRVIAGLDKDEALIEYVLPEDGDGYCLALTHRGANIIQLPAAKEISGLALNFLNDIQTEKQWKEDARALYDAVLAPIPDIKRFGRLTIVPDGNLHLVPFEALLSPSGALVGEIASTSYAPSAISNFVLKTRPGVQRAKSFLGVGGAVYDPAAVKSFTLAKATSRGAYLGVDLTKLPNLPGSLEEVKTAAEILRPEGDAVLQVGDGATEFAFTHAPLANFQVVHLAIHAMADKDDPSRAALIFPPDPQHSDDRLLEPRDIVGLHLGAQVVVLSACDTAVGRLQGQVGVANLARAFLQAGADSVISTLWQVSDVHSTYLMKAFYGYLAQGDNAAAALTLAKRDMLRESGGNLSPRLWAGFILLGNGDAALQTSQAVVTRSVIRVQ